jgi:outer membrane protein assembly factor BamB
MTSAVCSFILNGRSKISSGLKFRVMKILLSIVLILCFTASTFASDHEWRGWRGLDKQASSDSSGPVVWSSTDNILWKVHIDGEGFSSPVVSDNDVYITSAHVESAKIELNTFIFILLTTLIVLYILWNQYFLIKKIVRNGTPAIVDLIHIMVYGFLIFGFYTMCRMYFDESRNEGERELLTYLFSGALFLLCLLLSALKFKKKSIFRIITGIIVIIGILLLINFRPNTDFFLLAEFFKIKNLWLFQITVPAIILPVIVSLYLILKTMYKNISSGKIQKGSFHQYIQKRAILSPRLASFAAVLAGFSGFLAIPVIAAGKWLIRSDLARIQEPLNMKLFFDPGYAFPFFLGMISIGYLLWYIIELTGDGSESKERSGVFPVLVICSAVFFVVLNFGNHVTSYRREVICLDRHSGEIKWKRAVLTGPPADCSNYNSQATPTPLIDSNSVYSYFGSAGLIAADNSGNLQWKNTNLPFTSIHGAAASPVFWKHGIIILSSMSESPYLTSMDKKTGKEQWKTDLPAISGVGGEYRTPVVIEYEGRELIIEWSTSRSLVVVYEARTGKILNHSDTDWAERGEAITTPCVHEGILYLSDSKNVVALDIFKLMNNYSPLVWRTELGGRGPATSSPVLHNGMLFMISDNGFATCIDSKNGNLIWQEKLKGVYFSSPVAIGKRIYFSNTAGMTSVVESSLKYNLIAENVLPEGIYSTPAPVDGELFIRTKNTLWCIK